MPTSPISRLQEHAEFSTPERCFIVETLGIPEMSVARARVEPGVTTAWPAGGGWAGRLGDGRRWRPPAHREHRGERLDRLLRVHAQV